MTWEDIEIKLPPEVIASLELDSHNRVIDYPNITVKPFTGSERIRPHDPRPIMDDETLHKGMIKHLPWLFEQFNHGVVKLHQKYASPRVKIKSPLNYMLGVRTEFLGSEESKNVDMSMLFEGGDPALTALWSEILKSDVVEDPCSTPDRSSGVAKDDFELSNLLTSVDRHVGVEFSDEDDGWSGDEGSDVDIELEESTPKERKRLKRKSGQSSSRGDSVLPTPSDSSQPAADEGATCDPSDAGPSGPVTSILNDYYAPSASHKLDISSIEERMFARAEEGHHQRSDAEAELDDILLSILEKGDTVGFSKLVASMPFERVELSQDIYHDMFSWKSWLINGIHICFCGMGSKRQLMRSFVEFALKDGTCLTIDGYKVQGTNCDGLWQYVERELFNRKESKSVADSKQTVLSSIAELDMPFYLIIYGIDLLVVHNTLKFLRPLLKISNVRVIGTMDHLRSGVVVPSLEQVLSNLRLVEVDTNVDYRSELLSLWERHPPCYILREDQHKSASEMHAVISALNVNHRKLFSLIAEMQLAACSTGERFNGIEKYSLLRERRAITICNTESKLDALLTEFITHNLIQQSRGPGGKLYLMIPFPPEELQQFLQL